MYDPQYWTITRYGMELQCSGRQCESVFIRVQRRVVVYTAHDEKWPQKDCFNHDHDHIAIAAVFLPFVRRRSLQWMKHVGRVPLSFI